MPMDANTKKMSVVTGANGLVGSHLVDLLIEKGHRVKCIVRKTSNLQWLKDKPVEIIDSGLFDRDSLKGAIEGADYLFHVAGLVKAKKWADYYKANVQATESIMEVTSECNPNIKKVVIVSSLTAAGPVLQGEYHTEEVILNPITRYGRSKADQERAAMKFKDKLPVTICRAPAIYGERDTEIFLVMKTYKQGLMTMVGFDEKKVSLIHVRDFVRGLYLAAVSEKSSGEVYFISSSEFYSWPQISSVFKKVFGKGAINLRLPHFLVYTVAVVAEFFSVFSSKAATFNIEKARDFVQKYWTCDYRKAERDLGFKQEIPIEKGMQETVDWYKKMKWL